MTLSVVKPLQEAETSLSPDEIRREKQDNLLISWSVWHVSEERISGADMVRPKLMHQNTALGTASARYWPRIHWLYELPDTSAMVKWFQLW